MKLIITFLNALIILIGLVASRSLYEVTKDTNEPEVDKTDKINKNEYGMTTEMRNVEFVLANKEEGSILISQEDDYVNSLSDFDRSVRLQTSKNVTKEDYLSYAKKQTMDWSKNDRQKFEKIFESIKSLMKDYDLQFPKTIYFVKTTGFEEDNGAYCRGNNVVYLPFDFFLRSYDKLFEICIHELFHIYSRNNLDIREKLYNSIGFYKTGELVFPPEVEKIRMSNPDSVEHNYYFKGVVNGKNVNIMPLHITKSPYNSRKDDGLFSYMKSVFAEVEIGENESTLVSENGEYKFIKYEDVTNFLDTVGRNTQYTTDAEEIIADNFVILVTKKTNIKSPEIIESMKEIFGLK